MRRSVAPASPARGLRVGACLLALAAFLAPRPAWAHGTMTEPTAPMSGPGGMTQPGDRMANIEIRVLKEAALGDTVRVEAILTNDAGRPIRNVVVMFTHPAYWGEELNGPMVIGMARTDASGVATITTQLRDSGDFDIYAEFGGSATYAPASGEGHLDVHGDRQLYSPTAGIRVPGLNLWVLAGVIGLLWSLYFLVGLRVLAIARPPDVPQTVAEAATSGIVGLTSRREFLGRLVPFGAQAGIASMGAALVAVVARSPRTHGNLMAPPATTGYRRTPLAFIGEEMQMPKMPMPLMRDVSFSKEILPIFLANAGPHVVLPENSPPPGGLRLDSYAGVMAKEGVIVPGKPDESEIVQHMLDPAMQMPPSIPPLPDGQIQLIVTWIAQGAKDN